ncbi:MAG: aldo/keto reductase [Lachnospiraceae bacterium]
MKKAGKIRYVGLSNFAQKDVEKMMEYISVDCQQSLYNMLERNPATYHGIPLDYRTEKEVFPVVKKYGQAFLPYSPLMQGLLAGKFLDGMTISKHDIRNENPKFSGETFKVYQEGARKLKAFADEIGKPMNEMTLNWTRQREEVTSIIGGASSLEQLKHNIHCTEWNLTDEEIAKINEILVPFENMD